MNSDSLKVFGVRVPHSIYSELDERLYETAGVKDLSEYFDHTSGHIERGDPCGEVTAEFVSMIIEDFEALYESADFDTVEEQTDPADFNWVYIAGTPTEVLEFRDLCDATQTIKKADLGVIHTAILESALERFELPELSEEKISHQ